MGAEFLLYGYGLVCVSMLVFNLLYSFYLRAGDRRLTRREDRLRQRVEEQLEQLRQLPPGAPQEVQANHLVWMSAGCPTSITCWLSTSSWPPGRPGTPPARPTSASCSRVFVPGHGLRQAGEHPGRLLLLLPGEEQAAQTHGDGRLPAGDALLPQAGQLLTASSTPSRPCAASAGPPPWWRPSPSWGRGGQLHEKVITEALLSYKGDAAGLIQQLWARLDRFSLQVQRAVLDYIRFQSGGYSPQMLEILQDPRRHKELRLAAVRYFGKYPDPAAQDQLLAFLQETDPRPAGSTPPSAPPPWRGTTARR